MKESGLAVQPARDTSVQRGASAGLLERMHNLYDRIACRAYEIFDGNGRLAGRDLADWFQAEQEFLHPLHIGVSESPETLTFALKCRASRRRSWRSTWSRAA